MKKISVVSIMVILCSCSAKFITPTQSDVDRVANTYSGYTLAELNQGKSIYEQNCNKCHGLKKLSSQSEKDWNEVVPEMVAKANKKAGSIIIDAKAQEQLLKYVLTMRTAGKTKK
jgi:cytochrome c